MKSEFNLNLNVLKNEIVTVKIQECLPYLHVSGNSSINISNAKALNPFNVVVFALLDLFAFIGTTMLYSVFQKLISCSDS